MEMGAAAVAERTTKGVGQKLLKHAQTTRLREARESTKMYSCGGDTRTVSNGRSGRDAHIAAAFERARLGFKPWSASAAPQEQA